MSSPRSARPWLILAVGAFALFAVLAIRPDFLARLVRADMGESHPRVGATLSGLKLDLLTGGDDPVTSESLKGRVVLINFWGTWCPPCIQEFPHLADLQRDLRNEGNFAFVSVSCESDPNTTVAELRDATESFLLERRTDFPVFIDPDGSARAAVGRAVGFDGYPTTLVLDRDGIVRGIWTGYANGYVDQMRTLVERLLCQSSA